MSEGEAWAQEQLNNIEAVRKETRLRKEAEKAAFRELQFQSIINAVESATKCGLMECKTAGIGLLDPLVKTRCLNERKLSLRFSAKRDVYKFEFHLTPK
jgi:hypothetical protein